MAGALNELLYGGFPAAKEYIRKFNDANGQTGDTKIAFVHGINTDKPQEISIEVSQDGNMSDYFIFRIRNQHEIETNQRGAHMASTKSLKEMAGTLAVFDAVIERAKTAFSLSKGETPAAGARPFFVTLKGDSGNGKACTLNIGKEGNPDFFGKVFLSIHDAQDTKKDRHVAMLSIKELATLKALMKALSDGGVEAARALMKRFNSSNWPPVNSDTLITFDHKASKSPKLINFEIAEGGLSVSFVAGGAESGKISFTSSESISNALAALDTIEKQSATVNTDYYVVSGTSMDGEEMSMSVVGAKAKGAIKKLAEQGLTNQQKITSEFARSAAAPEYAPLSMAGPGR